MTAGERQLHGICTTAMTTMDQLLMDRDDRAPATFTGEFWDVVDSDDDSLASGKLNDDDDVNMRLSWCESYRDHQLLQQLTPPIDTGSSHSDDSLVSHR